MRLISTVLLVTIFSTAIMAQNIKGAWKWEGTDENGNAIMAIAIVADGFHAATWYDKNNQKFISTNGGIFSYQDGLLSETIEFDTQDSTRVGTKVDHEIELNDNEVTFKATGDKWIRIDDGSPGALAGAWLITGRKRDGQINERDPYRPRKTMKILSGTRFQWIAYNTETKQFMGTGGGTYATEDGQYTENIEFFSRDNSRVGASLGFNYELIEGKWHHSGNSSRGTPIYEIWSIRER